MKLIPLLTLFAVLACSTSKSPTPAASATAPALPEHSTLPKGDPCRIEAITVFAESCGGDCDRANEPGSARDACHDKCKSEIKERCKRQ